jgi:mono/diheme cytochrome c family protein
MRLATLVALAVLAAQPALAAKRDPQVERGREIARRVCAACHAVEPRGSSPVPKAAPFASREMQHVAGLEGRLAALTTAGHHGMPPQPLSPEDVRALLTYIESVGPSTASQ